MSFVARTSAPPTSATLSGAAPPISAPLASAAPSGSAPPTVGVVSSISTYAFGSMKSSNMSSASSARSEFSLSFCNERGVREAHTNIHTNVHLCFRWQLAAVLPKRLQCGDGDEHLTDWNTWQSTSVCFAYLAEHDIPSVAGSTLRCLELMFVDGVAVADAGAGAECVGVAEGFRLGVGRGVASSVDEPGADVCAATRDFGSAGVRRDGADALAGGGAFASVFSVDGDFFFALPLAAFVGAFVAVVESSGMTAFVAAFTLVLLRLSTVARSFSSTGTTTVKCRGVSPSATGRRLSVFAAAAASWISPFSAVLSKLSIREQPFPLALHAIHCMVVPTMSWHGRWSLHPVQLPSVCPR